MSSDEATYETVDDCEIASVQSEVGNEGSWKENQTCRLFGSILQQLRVSPDQTAWKYSKLVEMLQVWSTSVYVMLTNSKKNY